jgi:tetratricopeptide (TPR) repeat protein
MRCRHPLLVLAALLAAAPASFAQLDTLKFVDGKDRRERISEVNYESVIIFMSGGTQKIPLHSVADIQFHDAPFGILKGDDDMRNGKPAEALQQYQAALSLVDQKKVRPLHKQYALYGFARAQEGLGKWTEALSTYKRLLQEIPTTRFTREAAEGWMRSAQAKNDKAAIAEIIDIMRKDPKLATMADILKRQREQAIQGANDHPIMDLGSIENASASPNQSSSSESPQSRICYYRIIKPKHRASFGLEPMMEYPPRDIGELWIDLTHGRFVYRYYYPNQREPTISTNFNRDHIPENYKGILAPKSGTETGKSESLTLMAAAGFDGKNFWLSGPIANRKYSSIKVLNSLKHAGPFIVSQHEWYDLALIHQMFRHLENPTWDLEGLKISLKKSALVGISGKAPIDENRMHRLSADGNSYIFLPSFRSHDKGGINNEGGLWRYHMLLDDETPSIKSCYVTLAATMTTGPSRNMYFGFVDFLFERQINAKAYSENIFNFDSYVPLDALNESK